MYVFQNNLFFIGILGLVFGSFLTSFTYQIARENFSFKSLWRRSKCPKCGHTLTWRDNIPLLSFFLLGGKCRWCKKKISFRYPLIEFGTCLVFVLVGARADYLYQNWESIWALPFFLLVSAALIGIFITDLEHQIIPDLIIFPLIFISFLTLIIFSPSPTLFVNFLWASAGALFFLALNALTRGRGMGLGDVKLVFLIGLIIGSNTWLALFISFVMGAIVGLILVFTGYARFGKPIPFGPFLILGFFITLLWGRVMERLISGGVI